MHTTACKPVSQGKGRVGVEKKTKRGKNGKSASITRAAPVYI